MIKPKVLPGILLVSMTLSLTSCGTTSAKEAATAEVPNTISVKDTLSPTSSPTPEVTEEPENTATPTPSPTPTPEPTEEVVETVNFTQDTFDQMSKGLSYLLYNVYVNREPPYASGAGFLTDADEVYFDRNSLPEDVIMNWMQAMIIGLHDSLLYDENHNFSVTTVQNYMASMIGWNSEDPLYGRMQQNNGYYQAVQASGAPGWALRYISQESDGENVTVTAQLIQDYVAYGEVDRGDFAMTFQADENSMFGVHLVKVQRVREGETMNP